MVAPIDAKVTVDAGGEPITLAMNFRTIALAEDERPGCVTGFGSGKPKLSDVAALVWGFAQPAHPTLTLDEALALMLHHGKEVGEALGKLFGTASAPADKGGGAASGTRPRKPGGKPSTS